VDSLRLLGHGTERLLKHDLRRRCRADALRQIPQVRLVPGRTARVVQPVAQEKGLQAQLRVLQHADRRLARSRKITNRFVFDGRHVDRRQIARAKQTSELGGISPIRLHSLAMLLGDEGRGHDKTGDALPGERAIQAVSAGAGLVGDDESGGVTVKPSKALIQVGFSSADPAGSIVK